MKLSGLLLSPFKDDETAELSVVVLSSDRCNKNAVDWVAYKQQTPIFRVLEDEKYKIKVLADPGSGESLLPTCRQMAVFTLCPHVAKSRKEREKLSHVSSY